MIGIVVVSHSLELARATAALGRGLVPGLDVRVEIAAGMPGGELGTDATEVAAAIGRADDGDGVLVNPAVWGRVRVSCAPLVEGFVSAYAAAGIGRTLNTVAEEAERALEFKDTQMVR